jgi:hypothetical protein
MRMDQLTLNYVCMRMLTEVGLMGEATDIHDSAGCIRLVRFVIKYVHFHIRLESGGLHIDNPLELSKYSPGSFPDSYTHYSEHHLR